MSRLLFRGGRAAAGPAPAPAAPSKVSDPVITGSQQVGLTLTRTTPGSYTGYPNPVVSFQWYRSSTEEGTYAAISGATNASYVMQPPDEDMYLRLVEYAINSEGMAVGTSNTLGPVEAAPEIGDEILSDPVTYARNATGSGTRYDVGPGQPHADTDTIPWGTLGPGDVVNIHYQLAEYSKFGMRAQGTQSNPVVVNGVTSSEGTRPKIGAATRTAAGCNPGGSNNVFSTTPAFGESLGIIVIKRGPSDAYASYKPQWIELLNLDASGASNGVSYTTLAGGSVGYSSAAGLYCLLVADLLVQNCRFTNNGFGLFTQAKDSLLSEACERITFRSNHVSGNGVSGSFLEHGIYMQCASPIVEGNFIGRNRSESQGSSYKSRSSGEVFRYNWVEAHARACDWVHSEDQGIDGIVTLPAYGETFAYGNVIVNESAANPIHFGGDNLGEEDASSAGGANVVNPTYLDRLFFFSNTLIQRVSGYRASMFQPSLVGTKIEAWNNILCYEISGTVRTYLAYAGELNLRGVNSVSGLNGGGGGSNGTGAWDNAGASGVKWSVNEIGTVLSGNPLFVDGAAHDVRLQPGSPCIGAATGLPAGVPSSIATDHPVLYQPRQGANGWMPRPSTNDLGALEPEPEIVAAYFGGWENPAPGTAENTDRYWTPNFDDYPERWPLTGRVNEDDQAIIDHHLDLAGEYGIDAFAVCWYSDVFLSYAADRMAASTSTSPTKWCLLWAVTGPPDHPFVNRAWFLDSVRLAALRMNGDRYYRRNGKPVFVLFSVQLLDDVVVAAGGTVPSGRQALIDDMHRVVANVLGGDSTGGISGTGNSATVSGTVRHEMFLVVQSQDPATWSPLSGVHANTVYNVQAGTFDSVQRVTRSYAEMMEACRQSWTIGKANSNEWWCNIMAGWDMRPWGGSADPLHDNCLPTIEEFQEHVREAKAQGGTLFMFAWNEYGEGGWVCPTAGIGTTRLEALR